MLLSRTCAGAALRQFLAQMRHQTWFFTPPSALCASNHKAWKLDSDETAEKRVELAHQHLTWIQSVQHGEDSSASYAP